MAADQFLTEDRLFSFENVSLFQEVMGDICAEEVQVSEEEFLNLKCIDELEVNVLKSLAGNGNSLQFLEEFGDPQVPMWSNDNVVLDVEVITSIEDDEEPVYTDLNSHGSSGDDSDYGSESGTDQTSDMDLSQPSLELSQQQLEVLQNAARLGQFGQPVALQHNLMQGGMVKVQEEDVIKREQQYYQVPPIKLEPGLGLGTNQPNIAKELIDYNHNERYSNNNVTVENLYPQGVIPSVVASDDEDMEGVDSGTESCDSKDSGNKKNGERKRPGRKKGQVSKVYHLWEFIRDMLNDPNYCPTVIKWENEEEGIFRVIQSETVASLWGAKKNNRTKMTYEKMSRSIRYSRKEGYFADIPKNRGYPKKLCFKFGGKAHGWRRQVR